MGLFSESHISFFWRWHWGYTWWCSGPTSLLSPQNSYLVGLGGHMGFWSLNLGGPHARQAPNFYGETNPMKFPFLGPFLGPTKTDFILQFVRKEGKRLTSSETKTMTSCEPLWKVSEQLESKDLGRRKWRNTEKKCPRMSLENVCFGSLFLGKKPPDPHWILFQVHNSLVQPIGTIRHLTKFQSRQIFSPKCSSGRSQWD